MLNIECLWRNFNHSRICGPTKFSKFLIIYNKTGVCIKKMWLFFFKVFWWYHNTLYQIIQPELTRYWEKFVQRSIGKVCCITNECRVTFCAVEHKKLRIRHKYLYAKMWPVQLFWRSQSLLFDDLEKLRINESVKLM